MPTIVPPLNRLGRSGAEQRYPVACLSSAVVLTAQGHRDDAQTLRFIAAHVAAAPASWPAEVCMCAVIPCTESDWTHPGHCCRVASDHQVPFAATHAGVCARHAHTPGGAR
jgi:hypothetical protein